MKARIDAIIHLEQAEYLTIYCQPSDALLAEMEALCGRASRAHR